MESRELDTPQLRAKLVKFFRWNRCVAPEDAAQETLRRAVSKLNDPATEITVALSAWVHGIARNVLHEFHRSNREVPTDPASPSFTGLAARADCPENGILVQQCLARLSKEDRWLVTQYHTIGVEDLLRLMKVEEPGITGNAIRIRVHRIHKKIQRFLDSPPGKQF